MDPNIYGQMLRFFFLLSVTFAEDMKRAALSQVSEAEVAQYQKGSICISAEQQQQIWDITHACFRLLGLQHSFSM